MDDDDSLPLAAAPFSTLAAAPFSAVVAPESAIVAPDSVASVVGNLLLLLISLGKLMTLILQQTSRQ